tara:strand:+ start:226 stop:591 length:366 start_codon:yes stop_codon:yes gene_type:complete
VKWLCEEEMPEDTTSSYHEKKKRVYFYEDRKKHVDFVNRLRVDNLNQAEFYRAMIDGYLKGDPDLMCYVDKFKQRSNIQGISKRKVVNRLLRDADEVKRQFALNSDDVETIFDILESESSI